MSDYNNSKIYRIYSPSHPEVGEYIGSTANTKKDPLKNRFAVHKSSYKGYLKGSTIAYYSCYKILEFEDAKIELITDYCCENREELNIKEGEYIKKSENCVNIRVAGGAEKEREKEYRITYSEYILLKEKMKREQKKMDRIKKEEEYEEFVESERENVIVYTDDGKIDWDKTRGWTDDV
jgi:hypothetical protein